MHQITATSILKTSLLVLDASLEMLRCGSPQFVFLLCYEVFS
jgi:hypothetical protein